MPHIAEIDSFAINLPDVWVALPLERPAFERRFADIVAGWRAQPEWTRTSERRAEVLVQRARAELTRAGVTFIGAFCDVAAVEGAAPDAGHLEPLMAVCTYAVYSRNDLGTDAPLTLPLLWAAFTRRHQGKVPARITNLEPPSATELHAGRALRLRRLYEPTGFARRGTDGVTDPVYAESFVLPLGDDGEAAGVLQFATTNIDLAPDFSELFLAIARTLTVLTPDDATVVGAGAAPAGGDRG